MVDATCLLLTPSSINQTIKTIHIHKPTKTNDPDYLDCLTVDRSVFTTFSYVPIFEIILSF